MFKDNSRFSSLIEEKPKNNKKTDQNERKSDIRSDIKPNFFKNGPPPRNNYYNRNSDIDFQQEAIKAQEERKRLEEEETRIALSIENFPSLCSVKHVLDNKMSFISKIGDKNVIEEKVDYKKEEKIISIGTGWTEIKLNKETNKISMKLNVKKNIDEPEQLDLNYKVFNHLVYLHEKRTNEYIEKWGYDEWVHTFKFQNYDYHYFDKLDEMYEETLEDYEDNSEEEEEDQYWRRY
jgi:hypothetical protein